MRKILAGTVATASLFMSAAVAFADQPRPWQARFQEPATPIMEQIEWFEAYTLWFVIPITLFVLGLLGYCVFRFRASANPVPSKTSHNAIIEMIWTVAPVVILLFIAIPSFQLLTAQYSPPEEAKLTIKATGNQWNWDYEYQVEQPLSFNSALMADADRAAAGKEDREVYPRLLTVDNEMVVPVKTQVRVLVTAADVIHAFAMPAFGVKADAVPGRINEIWFNANKEGLYYGQCSELCGKDHAFMPIAIRVVTDAQYKAWLTTAQADLPGAYKTLVASLESAKALSVAGN